MKFSAIEIYNEAVRDLLSSDPSPLRLLDDPEVLNKLKVNLIYVFSDQFVVKIVSFFVSREEQLSINLLKKHYETGNISRNCFRFVKVQCEEELFNYY